MKKLQNFLNYNKNIKHVTKLKIDQKKLNFYWFLSYILYNKILTKQVFFCCSRIVLHSRRLPRNQIPVQLIGSKAKFVCVIKAIKYGGGRTEPALCVIISHLNYTHGHGAIEAAKETRRWPTKRAQTTAYYIYVGPERILVWNGVWMRGDDETDEMSCNMECCKCIITGRDEWRILVLSGDEDANKRGCSRKPPAFVLSGSGFLALHFT